MTAFGTLDTALDALSAGVFDYIIKPFKKESFLFTLHRAMRWTREQRGVRSLAALLELEPFGRARDAFEREYIRRLRDRTAGDVVMVAERSGLDAERVERLLRD